MTKVEADAIDYECRVCKTGPPVPPEQGWFERNPLCLRGLGEIETATTFAEAPILPSEDEDSDDCDEIDLYADELHSCAHRGRWCDDGPEAMHKAGGELVDQAGREEGQAGRGRHAPRERTRGTHGKGLEGGTLDGAGGEAEGTLDGVDRAARSAGGDLRSAEYAMRVRPWVPRRRARRCHQAGLLLVP